jgi:hypothetical protein
MHIVHGIVAVVSIIIFYSMCILISLTYFECRYIMNDASSRVSGRPIALFFTYEFIMIICYCFMQESNLDYLMIAIMLIGSYIVFWKIHIENPFYNYVNIRRLYFTVH